MPRTIDPFSDGDTFATFRNVIETTVAEIEALENDYVLKASPVELEQHYISKVLITPLTLDAANHYIESQDGTKIDVSHDFRRMSFDGRPIVVKGTTLRIAIPLQWRCEFMAYTRVYLQHLWVPRVGDTRPRRGL